jgi:hypothetical protein
VPLIVRPVPVRRPVGPQQRRTGQHGRQIRAGHDRASEGLQGDHQFQQAGALSAELLRDVQTQQSLLGEARPEGGTALLIGVERGAYDTDGRVALRPSAHRVGQCHVLLGQPDAHLNTPFAVTSEGPLAAYPRGRRALIGMGFGVKRTAQ